MDDDSERSDPTHLADRFDGLEAQVRRLRRDVDRSAVSRPQPQPQSRSQPQPQGADPEPESRQWPSPDEEMIELDALSAWVDQLQEHYAAAGDWLVPCWWRHRLAVHELAALRAAWLSVDTSEESSASLDWHEAAEKCRERISRAIGDGPGCTVVEHYPDRPVTDDPCWVEERTALRYRLSDRFGQTQRDAGTGHTRPVSSDGSVG